MRPFPLPTPATCWRDDHAAQLVEFAVALPLLVFFVVGIFDFSSAFTFKQRLTNMARDAAHVAAIDPSGDVQSGTALPLSVLNVFQIVDNYLLVNNLNDCGLSNGTPNPSNAGLIWTFTANTGCPAPGLKIVVNRGYYFPASGGTLPPDTCQPSQGLGSQVAVIATCVSVKYPYPWRFGRAASLLGFSDTLPPQITAIGVVMNED